MTAPAHSTSVRARTQARPSSKPTSGATRWTRSRRRAPMPEIRIDPLSGHRTIVAGERSQRPGGAPGLSEEVRNPAPIDPASDPFAEGNEGRTPPELFAVRPGGGVANSPGWTVRVVPNLFPALAPAGDGGSTGRATDRDDVTAGTLR